MYNIQIKSILHPSFWLMTLVFFKDKKNHLTLLIISVVESMEQWNEITLIGSIPTVLLDHMKSAGAVNLSSSLICLHSNEGVTFF